MWTKFLVAAAIIAGMMVLLVASYAYALKPTKATKIAEPALSKAILPQDDIHSKEYVLEVIGLGVTLDKYRQGALWEALAHGKPYLSIRDPNPKHYPWTADDKMGQSDGREGDSLENAILDLPRYWGIPAFNAEPRFVGEDSEDRPDRPQNGIVSAAGGMHILVLAHRELSEQPDRIIEKIFTFFDQNPSVPFVVLGSADSTYTRTNTVLPRPRITAGYYIPEMPDASAVLVIARRERVDAIRPFVFKDLEEPQPDVEVLNRDGIARRVWLNYLTLQQRVPTPPERNSYSYHMGRQPTGEEWLADLEIFAKQFDASQPSTVGAKFTDMMANKPRLSRHWKPKPWLPVPWNTEQLKQFDRLPTLGFLHRPVFVKMTDDNGALLKHAADREAALLEGWHLALQTLPEAEQAIGPARVIVATGKKASQLIEFHGLLRKVADEAGPKFDPDQPTKFINVDHRLGNTGAATFFMQTAIGILGSYREGGVSAAFNLRDPGQASIIFVSPPPEEKRKTQQHPIGGDVFQNATVPVVDPKNYEEPVYR
ncbi:hypothetical protein FHW58_005304 [Duganella sp. 1224]|uniref:type VI lipase adapter Tla3 domain-containing protein n=1 Tax=Duganella sp. 1224 TaxID=2587052 RepID=UPI0015C6DF63|nr:DUF2875 family protein [Duganella sp. 1224]NYE64069.1 hypothetical protein [Duganella sp. 1224]